MIERSLIQTAQPSRPPAPRHVAIIMDGNRRWARERNLSSLEGHRAGAGALRETVRAAIRAGVEILTVYAFSEENWRRDAREIGPLMDLVRHFAQREAASLRGENVRVLAIGHIEGLPPATRAAVETLAHATAGCDGLLLNLALNYGARRELCDAIRALALDVRAGKLAPDSLDDDTLSDYLYTAGLPDPDLLIRTGGELRVSNFLLYQIAYTELWSTATYWPDFDGAHLRAALADFSTRQRRFGS
jgi:undecaprenyl diphosphate synthase